MLLYALTLKGKTTGSCSLYFLWIVHHVASRFKKHSILVEYNLWNLLSQRLQIFFFRIVLNRFFKQKLQVALHVNFISGVGLYLWGTFLQNSLVYFHFLLGFSVPLFLYLVLSDPTNISLKCYIHIKTFSKLYSQGNFCGTKNQRKIIT